MNHTSEANETYPKAATRLHPSSLVKRRVRTTGHGEVKSVGPQNINDGNEAGMI